MTTTHLTRVSLTGPDDRTNLADLHALGSEYPFVEWALLYLPSRQGTPRNPSQAWRDAYWANKPPGFTALHLCGKEVFDELLAGRINPELALADRLQFNINARVRDFTDNEVLAIYATALRIGPALILQYNDETSGVIERFLGLVHSRDAHRIHVLMDASKGRGESPSTWSVPEVLHSWFHGVAGGLGPQTIVSALTQLADHPFDYWADMESNIRTDNELDKDKARAVLAAAKPFVRA